MFGFESDVFSQFFKIVRVLKRLSPASNLRAISHIFWRKTRTILKN